MPKNKEEWAPVMEFWSEVLVRRVLEEVGLYEVMTGVGAVPPPSS